MNDSNFIINILTIMAILLLLVMALAVFRNSNIVQYIINDYFHFPYFNIQSVMMSLFMCPCFLRIRDYINNRVEAFHLEPYFMPNHYYISSFLGIAEKDMKKFIEPTEIITVVSVLLTLMFSAHLIINKNILDFSISYQNFSIFLNTYLGLNDNYSDLTFMVCVCFIVAHLVYIIAWVMIALYLKIRI